MLLTGHSLGGALATLAAYDVALRLDKEAAAGRPVPHMTMVNFGSPRVGNTHFAADFDRLVPDAWRVINNNDAVCTVPRLMGYSHVGHAAKITPDGEVRLEHHTRASRFEGRALPDVLPAVGATAVAAVASARPLHLGKGGGQEAVQVVKRIAVEKAVESMDKQVAERGRQMSREESGARAGGDRHA